MGIALNDILLFADLGLEDNIALFERSPALSPRLFRKRIFLDAYRFSVHNADGYVVVAETTNEDRNEPFFRAANKLLGAVPRTKVSFELFRREPEFLLHEILTFYEQKDIIFYTLRQMNPGYELLTGKNTFCGVILTQEQILSALR